MINNEELLRENSLKLIQIENAANIPPITSEQQLNIVETNLNMNMNINNNNNVMISNNQLNF